MNFRKIKEIKIIFLFFLFFSQAIFDIEYHGGGTWTSKALNEATDTKFLPETGHRQFVPHVTMVVTDGETQGPELLPGQL